MVSEVSRFCDDRWNFIAETHNTNCVFRWDREFSDGSRLCDYPGIVEPLKLYFEALLKGRVISGRRPKIVSLSTNTHGYLAQFSEFLVLTRKKKSFAHVLPSDHFAYAEHLSPRDISAGRKSHSLRAVINFFNAEKLTGLKLNLGSKPEFPQSPNKLFRYNPRQHKQTPVIPDAVLWPLFNKTLSFVRDVGPYLLQVKERLDPLDEEYYGIETQPGKGHRAARPEVYKLYKFGTNRAGRDFHLSNFERLTDGIELPKDAEGEPHALLPEGVRDLNQLRSAFDHLLTSCYVLLGLVTGMRREELGSIEENCLKQKTLISGRVIWLVFASLRKGARENVGKITPWVCDECGVLAIETVEKLSRLQRKQKGTSLLFTTLRFAVRKRGRDVPEFARPAWGRYLMRHARLLGLNWHLKAHQMRRAFIRMVVRYAEVSLPTLQAHFKHLNSNMTEYYIGSDVELWRDWAQDRHQIELQTIADTMGDKYLTGGGGHVLNKQIDDAIAAGTLPTNFRGKAGDRYRLKLAEVIQAGNAPYRFLLTNLCAFRPEDAACNPGGEEPIAQFCQHGCKCNVASKKRHLPAWLLIARDTAQARKQHKNSALLGPHLLRQEATAHRVLTDFGVDPKNLPDLP